MKLNSNFIVIIVLIVNLTGCSANKQDLKASIPVPTNNTQTEDPLPVNFLKNNYSKQ